MPNRSRFASRLTLWAFAAALALKSAVPMLAAVAAGLQGRAVAEICDVYGVDTAALAVRGTSTMATDPAATLEHHHHGHEHMAAAAPEDRASPAPAPVPDHRHGSRAGDSCALSGMVAIAIGDAPALAGRVAHGPPCVRVAAAVAPAFDAAARWAALLEHGPPAFS